MISTLLRHRFVSQISFTRFGSSYYRASQINTQHSNGWVKIIMICAAVYYLQPLGMSFAVAADATAATGRLGTYSSSAWSSSSNEFTRFILYTCLSKHFSTFAVNVILRRTNGCNIFRHSLILSSAILLVFDQNEPLFVRYSILSPVFAYKLLIQKNGILEKGGEEALGERERERERETNGRRTTHR